MEFIKINIKIIVLSILISLLMYSRVIYNLIDTARDFSVAMKLSRGVVKADAVIDNEKSKVVFIFHGGWESVYIEAYELFNRFNYKGSVSVIPSRVGEAGYMTYKQLSEIYMKGWDLLNLSYSYKEDLYNKSDELLSDFNKARKWMKNRYIGEQSNMAVIPYGEVNPYLIEKLRSDGYKSLMTSDNIIILDKDDIEYYHISAVNLLTDVTVSEVINKLKPALEEPRSIMFILHKIENGNDGFGMTYSRDKLEQILMFIDQHKDKFQVVTYSQLF